MTTAHKAWNNLWLTKEKNNWIDADPFVKKAIPIFINKKYKKNWNWNGWCKKFWPLRFI